LRLANQNLCVLVRSDDGLGRDLAARLVRSGMTVHWLSDKLPAPDGARVVRAPIAGLEYDLAIVSCAAPRLLRVLSNLEMLEETPALVISRTVRDWGAMLASSGRSSLLVGVPGASAGTHSGAKGYGLSLGELDGAQTQRARLAQRVLERAGVAVRRSGRIDTTLRRQSLLALVEALCQLEARRDNAQVGEVRALARAQNAATPEAERLVRCAGWSCPDWAQLAARRLQAWAPMGPDEMRQLMAEVEDMAATCHTPIPVLADLGNAL